VLTAIAKALTQLSDRRTRRVLWWSVLATAALFTVLLALVWIGLQETRLFELAPLEWITDLVGGLAVVILALILFPGVAGLALSFFLEDVAAAVEARHYPDLPAPRRQSALEVVAITSRFTGATVALNLLALPVYGILFFAPPLNLFVFYALNGYLLGREYYELVALRRMDARGAGVVRRVHAGRVVVAGALIAFLSTLPVANLLTPVVATAFMVHVFEDLRRRAAIGSSTGSGQGET
jgi:uncharacterized protein involved in cysteine biosynthesis